MADPWLRLLLPLLLSVVCGSNMKLFFRAALLEEVASVCFLSLLSGFGDSGAEHPVVPVQHTQHVMLQAGLSQVKPLGAWV